MMVLGDVASKARVNYFALMGYNFGNFGRTDHASCDYSRAYT